MQIKYKINIITAFLLTAFFLFITSCKDKNIRTITILSEFKIQDYEFEVYHVVKKERASGILIKEYNDTVLVNICDFYKDFQDCKEDDDEIYRR